MLQEKEFGRGLSDGALDRAFASASFTVPDEGLTRDNNDNEYYSRRAIDEDHDNKGFYDNNVGENDNENFNNDGAFADRNEDYNHPQLYFPPQSGPQRVSSSHSEYLLSFLLPHIDYINLNSSRVASR